ncbi:MAG: S9 family peptidase [Simkaniaceae bacterium]|nr:S9 family peptidase [Simkaniaceae bacterium]
MKKIALLSLIILCALHAEWKIDSFLNVNLPRNIEISPNGENFVYANTTFHLKEDRHEIQLWQGKIDQNLTSSLLTFGKDSSIFPSYSPDGKSVAYLKQNGGALNLHILDLASGSSKKITDLPQGVDTFIWSPNSSQIAFIAKRKDSLADALPAYKFETAKKQTQLYLTDLQGNYEALLPEHYHPISTGDFGSRVSAFDWSPDGTKIAFAYISQGGIDTYYKQQKIAIVDLQNGHLLNLRQISPRQSFPKFSPDGKSLAFVKSDKKAHYTIYEDLALYNLESGSYKLLSKTPNRGSCYLSSYFLGWINQGKALLVSEPCKTKVSLWKVPVDGSPAERFDDDNWFFSSATLSKNGEWLGLNLQTSEKPAEAYCTNTKHFQPKKLTNHNQNLEKINLKTEIFQWESSDGEKIEGILTLPFGYQKGKRYPLILQLHGGPAGGALECFLGMRLVPPTATLAQKGFIVLQPNFRGSTGYGKKFRSGNRNNFGGRDFDDVMSGVDALIGKGLVDEKRMGVCGWSYGGYLTAWIVGKTDRFSAACIGAGILNLNSFNNTTDIHNYIPDYLPSETSHNLYKRSPINYVDNIRTPLLILHGAKDKRVPVSQAIEFYSALKRCNAPAILYLYRNGGHDILNLKSLVDLHKRQYEHFLPLLEDKSLMTTGP